ncbi:MAG: type II toxin-antitoxin system Phd/YefM family antitoxin [Bacilli bacterium]
MAITKATDLRKKLFETLSNVIEYNEIVTVNTKKGNAVIISQNDYESIMETVYLMSKPKLMAKIKEGEKEDPKDMKSYKHGETW